MSDIKYPRTYHLPWSPGLGNDDRVLSDLSVFAGLEVVVTEKHDGENTTLTSARCYARSVDSVSHFTRDWVRTFWSGIRHEIPDGWRFCGENLWARHAIAYDALPSFFLGFSVWDETDVSLTWDDGLAYMAMLGIVPVPVIYRGVWDQEKVHQAFESYRSVVGRECEGYVVRDVGRISTIRTENGVFLNRMAKWVRKGHVGDNAHWLYGGAHIEQNHMVS